MTGLYNRSVVQRLIDERFEQDPPVRTGSLFVVDIDNFKAVNDRLGHLFGGRPAHQHRQGDAGDGASGGHPRADRRGRIRRVPAGRLPRGGGADRRRAGSRASRASTRESSPTCKSRRASASRTAPGAAIITWSSSARRTARSTAPKGTARTAPRPMSRTVAARTGRRACSTSTRWTAPRCAGRTARWRACSTSFRAS